MKKTLVIIIAVLMFAALFMTSCGAQNQQPAENEEIMSEPAAEERPPETPAPEETEQPEEFEEMPEAVDKEDPAESDNADEETEEPVYRPQWGVPRDEAARLGMKRPEGLTDKEWNQRIREERIRQGYQGENYEDMFYNPEYVRLSRTDEENGYITNEDGTVTDVFLDKTFKSIEEAEKNREEQGVDAMSMEYYVKDEYLPVLYYDFSKANKGNYYMSVKDLVDARKGIEITYPKDTIVFKKYYDGVPLTPFYTNR